MKKFLGLVFIFCLVVSCKSVKHDSVDNSEVNEYQEITTEDYELSKPTKDASGVLILFGGFPENIARMKNEFKILASAKKNNIAVLFMNYNRKLWLTEQDKNSLKERIETIFSTNKLSTKNIYIGGFSSGGSITLLLTDYLIASKSPIQPKGLFVIDSPIDLLELYRVAERNLTRNFSDVSVQEATWLIGVLKSEFGDPKNGIKEFEASSPYTAQTENIKNLSNLNGLKIRFYSEPDTVWWKENRNNEPNDLNAYWIGKLVTQLKKELSDSSIEYISTENKGYRANGERHPHSWAIVDKEDLIAWMLKK
jgi:hypothetical protein